MPRTCSCAGPCGPGDEGQDELQEIQDGVSRRGFLTLLGTGAISGGLAVHNAEAATRRAAELESWKLTLKDVGTPRVYRSDRHTDVRFPLGGIGTGSFELGPDGQFTIWQLCSSLRDGHIPFFFGIKAGKTAKILQTVGGPSGMPTVKAIEMTGEYPIATLRYSDPDLPVRASMTAFTPFAPLDSAISSLPVACFVFRLENTTQEPQTVSLGAFLQNPIGYDAFGPVQSFNSVGFNAVPARWDNLHFNFGGNYNEQLKGEGYAGLNLAARPASPATSEQPIHLMTNRNPGGLRAQPVDFAPGFRVSGLDGLTKPLDVQAKTIIWIEDAPADLTEETLTGTLAAVRGGATLVWSGQESTLLSLIETDTVASAAPDTMFEDFESGYGKWTVTGDAFGTAPATGTLEGQQVVAGFHGKGLVNSFLNGDVPTGKMTSQPFTIERRFIRFLVGGGAHPNTQMRLLVDGKIVRRKSGREVELLEPAVWDVAEFKGKTAHIEIVDENSGGWGHINVDDIIFSDLPAAAGVFTALKELAPAPLPDVPPGSASIPPGARHSVRKLAEGQVIRIPTALLAPSNAELIGARQRAFAVLASVAGIKYTPPVGVPAAATGYGNLALGVLGGTSRSVCQRFTDWNTVWPQFAEKGTLPPGVSGDPTPAGQTINGAVAASVTIPPGKSVEVPFVLAWRYPNRYADAGATVGNHYATQWKSAADLITAAARDFPKWHARTEAFRKTTYNTTLPYWLTDCVTSQISTLRHPGIFFRIANGDVYGWEGSNGCCPPTCTHVWGYEITISHLFPDLERLMRKVDFKYQQMPDGGVRNRTVVPSPGHPTSEQPFSDGHSSCVLKAYREALLSADDKWSKEYWPHIKRAVEYLIERDAATSGGTPDGTLSDDQWNTYDNAIHGINTFIGSYYLAALRAGEEMAKRMGDTATAQKFHAVFEKGRENQIKVCWNGEYFYQNLPDYEKRAGEYGPGCLSDQLIGQWWAHQLGLGYLFPKEHIQTALKSIYKYNWKTDFTNFQHNWRKFAGGTDKGLLICSWPKGGRPANTIPYVDEVWTGVEYQVAAHMIYEGMIEEGLAIARGVRDRYDGIPRAPMPRNPWNEIECGGHYARAMSSWSLLTALSGFSYDGPKQVLRVAPRITPENFKSFFSAAEGWGGLQQTRKGNEQKIELTVDEGKVAVRELHVSRNGNQAPKRVQVQANGKTVRATLSPAPAENLVRVVLDSSISIAAGSTLVITTNSGG